MKDSFYDIDEVLVNSEIAEIKFTCDLNACKGACCTMESEYGAPTDEDEIAIIEKYLDKIMDKLPASNRRVIKDSGFWEEKEGDLMISSINNKDCVFAVYENGVAKCAIEKMYFNGELDFRKPLSCHLFPIRISNFGGPILRFEEYNECKPALAKGLETKISTLEFCKDALIRKYGESWYNKLVELAGS